jgi:putative membrane protein
LDVNTVLKGFAAIALALLAIPAFAQSTKPNDAQIAAIVVAANQVDIDAGKLATKQASDPEVKAFAERMVTDHSAANQQATALVSKLKVKPEENELSKKLKADGAKTLDKLRTLKGDKFDQAYIDHEVTYHQAVLDTIDKTLLPNAQNAELKALITKVRPVIQTHLEHAQQLQASLK